MFYKMQEEKLAIFDDNKEQLLTTLELMPQLANEHLLETDIVTAEELRQYPNKVIVDDIEIEIEVPDYEITTEEYEEMVYDEEGNPVLDAEGNFTYETKTRMVEKQIMVEVEETILVPVYDEYGELIEEREKLIIKIVPKTHTETITVKGLVLNPNYEVEQETKRQEQFNKDFFLTSLGYIRRKVTMKTGETKDFLSDLLPVISMGVQSGQAVTIIAYKEPDFTTDIVNWESLQEVKTVTAEFISECFARLSSDFTG